MTRYLIVEIGVHAMDRHHARNVQLPAEQNGGMSAGKGGVSMDHVDGLRPVQLADLRDQTGVKKGAG